jgi:RND family efflux transporter MFP subunit
VTRRWLAAAVAILAVACGGGDSEEDVETSTPVPVVVDAARVGAIRALVSATGNVAPAPDAEWTITAPQPARVLELPRAVGDRVRAGDLLARFEIPSLDADVAAKQAEVTKAEARLANARAAERRVAGLYERGIAARKEVEDAGRELAEAEAALAQAEAARSSTALLAERATVRARFDGVIAERWHHPGDLVDASNSDPVLRVIDPRRLQVEAAVPVPELSRVVVGSLARVFGPAGMDAEKATVQSRSAAVDPSTGTGTLRLTFVEGTRLPAGTAVRIEIEAEEHQNAVIVPVTSIVREGGSASVFVVGSDGHARLTVVTVGIVSGSEAEIVNGVAAGDPVIVRGQVALPDGAAVTVEK